MIIDTHVHLTLEEFDSDRNETIDRAYKADVKMFIEVGFSVERSLKVFEFAKKTENVYCSLGIHPHDALEIKDIKGVNALLEKSKDPKVVAWGEIGLDYFRDLSPRDVQKDCFTKQLGFANEQGLPVIIHCRDAHADMKKILSVNKGIIIKGVVHSFSGNTEDAKYYNELGLKIGVGCPITYPKSDTLRQVVKNIPLTEILLETDAPYLPPQPFRGKRNESAYLTYVIDEIVKIKGISKEEVADITTNTARNLFGI
ncbi:MAG: TatD family hydrolase [Elusimicrobiota bacterium]